MKKINPDLKHYNNPVFLDQVPIGAIFRKDMLILKRVKKVVEADGLGVYNSIGVVRDPGSKHNIGTSVTVYVAAGTKIKKRFCKKYTYPLKQCKQRLEGNNCWFLNEADAWTLCPEHKKG
jgi:hypothetical protein